MNTDHNILQCIESILKDEETTVVHETPSENKHIEKNSLLHKMVKRLKEIGSKKIRTNDDGGKNLPVKLYNNSRPSSE